MKNKHIKEANQPILSVDLFWQHFLTHHSRYKKDNLISLNLVTETDFIIAYSGGCDSHVLLHLFYELKKKKLIKNIQALHVNHQLHQKSAEWAEHCVAQCERYQISCDVVTVNVDTDSGKGLESAARTARYGALKNYVSKNNFLLTAQHKDDQAETFLLQSLRGSGVKGLAAMPLIKPFSQGYLARPLLSFSQQNITEYAKYHKLEWLEDPSNTDTRLDRNYLRKKVIPLLKARWPALDKTSLRVTEYQAEAVSLLNDLAEIDLEVLQTDDNLLLLSALKSLSVSRQKNVIRYWLHNIKQFPMPDSVHLARILNEVICTAGDAQPCVSWKNTVVRRFKDKLYADSQSVVNFNQPLDIRKWSPDTTYTLSDINGKTQQIVTAKITGEGLSISQLKNRNVEIRFRQGGEVCCPQRRGPHQHKLKKLFQEWQVPPWLRNTIPLIYVDNELAQVVGYCLCEPFAANTDESAYKISLI